MGSVVKSIGKVFKKIGRAIKKVAPLILVAAAAYVGYGYATGFTGGGWPRITQWGKSLMSGIRGGNTISQAASQASQSFGQVASNVAPTSVPMDPGMGPGGASEFASQGLLGASQPGFLERAGTAVLDTLVPPAGASDSPYTAVQGLEEMFKVDPENNPSLLEYLSQIGSDTAPMPSGLSAIDQGLTARSIRGRPPSLYEALFNPAEEQLVQAQASGGVPLANPNAYVDVGLGADYQQATSTLDPIVVNEYSSGGSNVTTDVATGAATNNPASTPNMRTFTSTGFSDIRTLPNQTLFNKGNMVAKASNTWRNIAGLAGDKIKEAAAWYKNLWASDPLVAMYGTQKIAEMMLTFLDKSAEKEAEAKAAVAGFPRRSFSDVMKSNRAARRRGASHTGGLLA
jgi:hypothetical protein